MIPYNTCALPDWDLIWFEELSAVTGWMTLSWSPSSSDSELSDGPVVGMVGGSMFALLKGEMDDIVYFSFSNPRINYRSNFIQTKSLHKNGFALNGYKSAFIFTHAMLWINAIYL